MKKLSFILACSLLTSSIALPVDQERHELIKRAESAFNQFKKELNEYLKCIKRDADCDPKKTEQLKTAAKVITGAVAVLVSGTLIKNLVTPQYLKLKIEKIVNDNGGKISTIGYAYHTKTWIIRTTQELNTATEESIVELLRSAGYDVSNIIFHNDTNKNGSLYKPKKRAVSP